MDACRDDPGGISVEPLDPEIADFLRLVMTFFDLHESCRFKVCRRAHACATQQVLCYQEHEEHLKPIVGSIQARHWARAVARGEEMDVAPAAEGDMRRLIAWEEQEIAKIQSGEYGNDDELSVYQLWLLNLAREEPHRPEAGAFSEGDLWPALSRPSR